MQESKGIEDTAPDDATIHIVAGPTASGKSAYAIRLAQAVNGVIINADSLQIYDGLPILSAQPGEKDKAQAPHLLYAHLHPNHVCSAGNWREAVEPLIEDILKTGQVPIITGGSGLYIKTLTHGLSPIPDVPATIRNAGIQLQKELGNPGFYAALKKRDPEMAARLHPGHTARLLRAWEVLEATGKSLAEWQKLPPLRVPQHWRFKLHKMAPERDVLRARCDQRFLEMIAAGAIDEAAAFSARIESGEIGASVPLTKALGFAHLRDHTKGLISLDDAIERAQSDTRQYAKRQMTWFRHQL